MTEAIPQIESLRKEPNPLRWPIRQAGEDIEATFVNRLGLLKTPEVNDLIKNTHYLFLPG